MSDQTKKTKKRPPVRRARISDHRAVAALANADDLMPLDEIKELLRTADLTEVARAVTVQYPALFKLAFWKDRNAHPSSHKALSNYFRYGIVSKETPATKVDAEQNFYRVACELVKSIAKGEIDDPRGACLALCERYGV